jgi:hypothetical protein
MGKGRERQIILKTDQRTIFLEVGLGGKFQAESSEPVAAVGCYPTAAAV